MCIGVSISLLKITTSLFLAKPPLNQQIVQVAPALLGKPPSASILFFFLNTPLKVRFFSLNFPAWILVMTEKNIFVYYKLFLSLNISDFNLLFLIYFIAIPLKKVIYFSPFPVTPFKSFGAVKPLQLWQT